MKILVIIKVHCNAKVALILVTDPLYITYALPVHYVLPQDFLGRLCSLFKKFVWTESGSGDVLFTFLST